MADDILLVMAKRNGRWIAGAINFIGSDTLFGRHWGAIEHHNFLHFEVCYYQAIDFAIQRGLKRVEAGAQGEHKLARGYMPTETFSAHYIPDPGFRHAVADYLKRERQYVSHAVDELAEYAPFRKADQRTSSRCSDEDTMVAYDNDNIFAKILRGELPAFKVYEDDKTFAFLDIMPRCPGHTLVIPKAPARNIFDITPEDFAAVARTTQKVALAVKKAFAADGVTLQQANERAGGQVVFHLHMHVMPRHDGVVAAAAGKPQGRHEGARGPRHADHRGAES